MDGGFLASTFLGLSGWHLAERVYLPRKSGYITII